ncbi:MAG: hypothetical protein CMD96_08180 [Gammaproteobacteria bacterium]|nr:hypothetical protein [Gammaproteobacteria bacterium]|tara:strand:- start:1943 stop:2575 length:633 start_codon:yes stop_codon:yes gene_type:complete
MEHRNLEEEKYWDDQVDVRIKVKNKQLSYNDNFFKRSEILRKLLAYHFDKADVLEIGCALPTLYIALKSCANLKSYKGTDVSGKYCAAAKEICGVDARKAKANCLPFESDSFNTLFAFDVLEHIHPDERHSSYKEIDRVLKKDAIVFINNPLAETQHDLNFDHELDDADIVDFSISLGMSIDVIEKYTIPLLQGDKPISYQWIVMSRGEI